MIASPEILHVNEQPYTFIPINIPRTEMHAVLPPTLHELFAVVKNQGLPILPWFAHHLTLNQGHFDFEACVPVDASFVPADRVQRGLWSSGTVARTVYQGDYIGLPAAWHEFNTWITQQGRVCAGHVYEHYTVNQGTTKNPAEFRTEMSWPLITSNPESEQA